MASNPHDRPCLHNAIFNYKKGEDDLLRMLQDHLDDGENINEKQPSSGRTPLYFLCGHIEKCGEKSIEFLINRGADPMIADHNDHLPIQRYIMEKNLAMTADSGALLDALNLFNMREHCEELLRAGKSDQILDYLGLSRLKGVDLNMVNRDGLKGFIEAATEKRSNTSDILRTLGNRPDYFVELFNPDIEKTDTERNFLVELSAIIPSDEFKKSYIDGVFTDCGEMQGLEFGVTEGLEKALLQNTKLFRFFADNIKTIEEMIEARPAAEPGYF